MQDKPSSYSGLFISENKLPVLLFLAHKIIYCKRGNYNNGSTVIICDKIPPRLPNLFVLISNV